MKLGRAEGRFKLFLRLEISYKSFKDNLTKLDLKRIIHSLTKSHYDSGIVLIICSFYVNRLLGDSTQMSDNNSLLNTTKDTNFSFSNDSVVKNATLVATLETAVAPDVPSLTIMFSVLFFLAATQDIAVDGWALTMLKPINVGFAATCNMLGQQLGRVVGYTVFTTLEAGGSLDTAQFMLLWGVLFLLTTTAIAVFKKEETISEIQERTGDGPSPELELSPLQAYKMLWRIIVSPRMYIIIIIGVIHKE